MIKSILRIWLSVHLRLAERALNRPFEHAASIIIDQLRERLEQMIEIDTYFKK